MNPIKETALGLREAWLAAKKSFEPVPDQVKKLSKEVATDIKEVLQEEVMNLAYGISALPKFLEQEFVPGFINAVTWVAVGSLAIANAAAPQFVPAESLQSVQIGLGIGNGLLATIAANKSIALGGKFNQIKAKEATLYNRKTRLVKRLKA